MPDQEETQHDLDREAYAAHKAQKEAEFAEMLTLLGTRVAGVPIYTILLVVLAVIACIDKI